MLKVLLSGLLLPISVFAEVNFDGNKNNIKETMINVETPAPQVSKATKTTKEWTIMVFLNAKNDLERFGISDMNEMETVGSNDNLNIVVQMGRIKGYDSSNGDWTGVRRYYVTKDTDRSIINSQLIENMGEVDMGSYKTLIDFAKWAKKNYPAKKYALVIWNHGSGWEKGFKSSVTKGISYDEQSGNHINTPQLGMAMKEIGKVDILDFDACLMQMAEVAYEIKDYVTYIVASEETEPGDGDSYDGFLAKLVANPTMGPLDLSKAIVDAYSSYYSQKGEGTTKSVIRAEQMPGLLDAVNNFAYALSQSNDKTAIKNAASSAQSYAISDNKDLYHFAKLLSNSNNAEVKAKSQALMDFIKNKLVAYNKTTNGGYSWYGSSDYSNSYGIAIYLPSYSVASGYTDLQWSKYSNWDEFLVWYTGKDATTTTTTPTTPSTGSYYDWLFGGKI
ncbi:MAG TPA: clostripain-related cysteine peptidase [Elusimicrobiales bacterium]|nr:clostripain-related cysteine peptidase [Elusimicrobiales bacterium]